MSLIERFKGHLTTINQHKLMVMKHCFRCGLYKQGLLHDLSKYMPDEFIPGVRYFQGDRSPNNAQREAEGCSSAWLHHKGRNKHHFEYWIDYPVNKAVGLTGMQMPVNYVIEMFCDRVAACKTYNKDKYKNEDALNYFLRGQEHYVMHEDAKNLLYKLLNMLSVKGEDYTFAYIRKVVLKNK
ncbi:MAG: catalase [Clostridiales bacterium]|nr:catalase [Clostridiales bacterium]